MRSLGLLHLNMLSVLDAAGFRLPPRPKQEVLLMPGRIEQDTGWFDSGPVDDGRDADAAVRTVGRRHRARRPARCPSRRIGDHHHGPQGLPHLHQLRRDGGARYAVARARHHRALPRRPAGARGRGAGRRQRHLPPAHRPDHAQGRSRQDDGHVHGDARRRPFRPAGGRQAEELHLRPRFSGRGGIGRRGRRPHLRRPRLRRQREESRRLQRARREGQDSRQPQRLSVRRVAQRRARAVGREVGERGHLRGEERRQGRHLHSVVRRAHTLGSQPQRDERRRHDTDGQPGVVEAEGTDVPSITASPEMLAAIFEDEKMPRAKSSAARRPTSPRTASR